MPGAAADHSRERVAAPGVRAAVASPPGREALLRRLEGLVLNDRQVGILSDDPLLLSSPTRSSTGVLGLGEVEAIPDRATGVDGVLQHRPDCAGGPIAA
jgi:hypothetical protein